MQKERLEAQWPHSASRLLLRLSADERAYDAPIFDTGGPLTKCLNPLDISRCLIEVC